MRFSISWYAIPETTADQFVQKLGFAPTGKTEEIPESLNCMGQARDRLARYLAQQVRLPVFET